MLDATELKEFADDRFDENGRKFSKRVENTKEKLLVTSVFKRCILQTHKNQGLFWKGLTQTTN